MSLPQSSPKAEAWTLAFCVIVNYRVVWEGEVYKRRTHMRNQCLLGLQSVSRCLVGSACWGKQVAHYSQEKKGHLTDKGSKHGRTRWTEESLEISRRWVVTPTFLSFSKMTEHIGEGEKARQGNTGFWRLRKAPAVIQFVLLQEKVEADSWPRNYLLNPSIQMCSQQTRAFQSQALPSNISFFSMIHPWEVQMYCLFMGVPESQIEETR